MSAGPKHPDLLLFVAGQVGRDQAADIAAHLKTCPECRSEAETLRSMKTTMLSRAGSGHARVDDLILYDEEELADQPDLAASIERHLVECADCRADLGSLQAARRLEAGPDRSASRAAGAAAPGRPKTRWTFAAAALLAAAALFPLVRGLRPSAARPPASSGAPAVTFAPPRRGGVDEGRLAGNGPWSITVVLPFGASPGSYLCRIARADGTLAHETAVPLASGASSLGVEVEPLPPGPYRLLVGPGPGMDAPYVYPFHVEGSAP